MASRLPDTVRDASTIVASSLHERPEQARVPGMTILAHPDSRRVGERVALPALTSSRGVLLSRLEPLFAPPNGGDIQPLADPHLSRAALRLARANEGFVLERGEVGTRAEVDGAELEDAWSFTREQLERGVTLVLADRVALLIHPLEPRPRDAGLTSDLVGESAAIAEVRRQIRQVAPHATTVLLRGETGTGKELVARAIHHASPGQPGPWVTLNMGAVPASLATAELFGAARGAYTGAARKRPGYFRKAHGGTLFLDEIGETPAEVQPLLLRALETGEIQPVGAGDPVTVDVRVIAATDLDLESEAEAGRFRTPLLHRLGGYQIRLPPLRDRRDDVGRLLFHFLRAELTAVGQQHRLEPAGPRDRPWLPASQVARLARYDWPGNVRQLRNLAVQLTIRGLDVSDSERQRLIPELLRDAAPREADSAPPPSEPPSVEAPGRRKPTKSYRQPHEVGDDELLEALRASRWRLKPAAARLGVSRSSLYGLIDSHPDIRRATELGREEIEACRARHEGDLDAMAEELEVSRHGLQRRMRELARGSAESS